MNTNPTAQTTAQMIELQKEIVEIAFIQRTDSDAKKAFWSLQVGVLNQLVSDLKEQAA